jgi:lysophospholipase L1-like esterase
MRESYATRVGSMRLSRLRRMRPAMLACWLVLAGFGCGCSAPGDPLLHDAQAVEPGAGAPSAAGSSASTPAAGGSDLGGSGGMSAAGRNQADAAASGGASAQAGSGRGGSSAQAGAAGASLAQAGRGAAGAAGSGGAADVTGLPPLGVNVTLHIVGDSTAAIFPASDATHRVGWGSVLQQFFGPGVQVDDAAQSGRSSKSFIDEGLWSAVKAKLHTGDYVFIEFAHNDEKMDDAARYTDPATTFRSYLKTYLSETRALGAVPVLLTPISRRQFSGDKIVATHGAYSAAVMAVAMETGTPVIDMTDKTRVLLESLGPAASVALFATGDNTHLSAKGAPEVAKLAVQGIRELGLPLAQRLLP